MKNINSQSTNTTFTGLDETNNRQQQAYELVAHTNQSFFLTGRAGTGKTTFLKKVQEMTGKQFIVVAPTGIAAIVAGGVTIHSFFGLDLNVQGPKDLGKRIAEDKKNAIISCDTIIIESIFETPIESILSANFCRDAALPIYSGSRLCLSNLK